MMSFAFTSRACTDFDPSQSRDYMHSVVWQFLNQILIFLYVCFVLNFSCCLALVIWTQNSVVLYLIHKSLNLIS